MAQVETGKERRQVSGVHRVGMASRDEEGPAGAGLVCRVAS